MLSLTLAKIRDAHERFEQVYRPEQLAVSDDAFRVAAPVNLAFDIHKDKDQFRLAGSVNTTLELPCSRCLEPFTTPLAREFDLRYHPHTHAAGSGHEAERQIEEDDLTTAFYENDTIDLGQMMREQFFLALPMKPLCRDECKGLCPVCGINWNKGACNCSIQWEDPRLAALKALRRDS